MEWLCHVPHHVLSIVPQTFKSSPRNTQLCHNELATHNLSSTQRTKVNIRSSSNTIIMAWRNQGITGSNNIPLGRRRFGGDESQDDVSSTSTPAPATPDVGVKRGRSPVRGEFPNHPSRRSSFFELYKYLTTRFCSWSSPRWNQETEEAKSLGWCPRKQGRRLNGPPDTNHGKYDQWATGGVYPSSAYWRNQPETSHQRCCPRGWW